MLIKKLRFHDKNTKWRLDTTPIDSFNLFVGISGVGKSKILKSIMTIRGVTKGETDNLGGIDFSITFATKMGEYEWNCTFDKLGLGKLRFRHIGSNLMKKTIGDSVLPDIKSESLTLNGTNIFKRSFDTCTFKGLDLPKISTKRSVLEIFSSESEIKDVRENFLHIFFLQFASDMNVIVDNSLAKIFREEEILTESEVITSDLNVVEKLAYYYIKKPQSFEKIKKRFFDIFPHVTDINFMEDNDRRYFVLNIKERDTSYIAQDNISAGMFKTLMFLAQMEMLEGETVVLIDEAENSLGLNCIDILTEELYTNCLDDQFLITSHHPYIINNIPMERWKIVMREGSQVTVKTAKEAELGDSFHDSFFQLINNPNYKGGIK